MAGLPLLLTTPVGVVGCEPLLAAATLTFFGLNNRRKVRNLITATVNPPTGYFAYLVENLPKDGMGCPGRWLFRLAWEHFQRRSVAVTAIRGEWSFGDNLDVVNGLTRGSQRTIEEAATQTWAAERARECGMPTVTLLASVGVPGGYRSIDVLFTP